MIKNLYNGYGYLLDSDCLSEDEKEKRYYGKKVILLLDEYDIPMQEAYVHGCCFSGKQVCPPTPC